MLLVELLKLVLNRSQLSTPTSKVQSNGFSTYYFALSRGVRQGYPLSPFLFVLAIKLLACKIRQDKEIQGIKIFRKDLKISQFADDTTLLNRNRNSVHRAPNVLENFGNLSGPRLNSSQTKVLWLGPWRHCKETPFDSSGLKNPSEHSDLTYLTM